MDTPSLAEKVAFLAQARNHPFAPARVTVVETHMSWVFLTDLHAYKLKKAIRTDEQDLTTVEAREAQCRNEAALNARFSRGVYLGILPLTVDTRGALELDRGGRPVDWLVWMRRLPAERMLDYEIATGRVDVGLLRECIANLARFYRTLAPVAAFSAEVFRGRMAGRVVESRDILLRQDAGLQPFRPAELAGRQLEFLSSRRALFDARIGDGRVVEAHGDLRPEHVCLESPPQLIDCLEFSQRLRTLDAAEEMAFLALECERLGAPQLHEAIFRQYCATAGDAPPHALVSFYKSLHASVRARLAVAHLDEPAADTRKWLARGAEYMRLATLHLEATISG